MSAGDSAVTVDAAWCWGGSVVDADKLPLLLSVSEVNWQIKNEMTYTEQTSRAIRPPVVKISGPMAKYEP
jgi:hypothetical protein